MKKLIIMFILAIMLSLALTCANAAIETETIDHTGHTADIQAAHPESVPVFKLPASLKIIEDEAFEGTAIVSIDLPGLVESIGDRAFAGIPGLRAVKIPEKTTYIATTAFAGSNHVMITGAPGSYARTWARENGVPFAPVTYITANGQTVQTGSYQEFELIGFSIESADEGNQNATAGKTVREFSDERYEEGIAYHIQGRAPPALGSGTQSMAA